MQNSAETRAQHQTLELEDNKVTQYTDLSPKEVILK